MRSLISPTGRARPNASRWIVAVWLIAWALFSFPWTSITPTPHWDRFRAPHVRRSSHIRTDHVLNVLFYLPAAPLGAAFGYPLAGIVMTGAALSLTAEGLQLFSLDRAPDGNDIVANIGGTVGGAVAVLLYRRRRISTHTETG